MPGVLADHQIRELDRIGAIRSSCPISKDQYQPASLDLRLGSSAHRVRSSFLPGLGCSVHEGLKPLHMHKMDLRSGAVLEKGCVYLVELQESLQLPEHLQAVANAKSSTGRLDILTRLVTNDGCEFDRVKAGYSGPLFAEICPLSFSVLVRTGTCLNQIRFRDGSTALSDAQLTTLHAQIGLTNRPPRINDGLGFSVDLLPRNGPAGYRAKQHSGILDLDEIGHYAPEEFWEPVEARDGKLILDPHAFYILVSKEAVIIPPTHAAEMTPYIAMIGEFRVHYAGFFDPGFGYGMAGGNGARAVLEVRCHQAPFLLEDGQLVGRLVYEHMAAEPTIAYGTAAGSNYQGQKLKLSKHFSTE